MTSSVHGLWGVSRRHLIETVGGGFGQIFKVASGTWDRDLGIQDEVLLGRRVAWE